MLNSLPPLVIVATLSFIALCCVSDVRTRRIPNALTGAGLLAGLILNGSLYGGPGIAASTIGFVVPIALLLAPFALGGIGGGDVKMMGAVGALLGPRLVLAAMVLGMLSGGAVMVAHLATRGRLREKMAMVGGMTAAAVVTRSIAPLRVSAEHPDAITLPYSVPLAIGTALVLLIPFCARLL